MQAQTFNLYTYLLKSLVNEKTRQMRLSYSTLNGEDTIFFYQPVRGIGVMVASDPSKVVVPVRVRHLAPIN